MTRVQLIGLGLLSLVATVLMLVAGAGSSSGRLSERVVQALDAPRTAQVVLPAAPAADADVAADDAPAVSAEDDDADTSDPAADGDDSSTPADAPPVAAEDPADDAGSTTADTTPTAPAAAEPDAPRKTHVGHVFVVALAGQDPATTFGPQSATPYLAKTLRPLGTLLSGYRTLGRSDLADRIALISGQPPNADTRAGCPTYTEIPQTAKPTTSGEIRARGCAYPSTVITLGDQVTASGRTWRAYVEDLDKGPDGRKTCRRPASGAVDDTQLARPGDGYAARHNPFVYFHSLLDLGDCDASDGPLERLTSDLAAVKTTPAYAFVAPNLCHDGTTVPCADGSPGGAPAADAFLATWIPRILASPAYRRDGLLIVTFTGTAVPGAPDRPVRTGALLVSRFARAGADDAAKADPYTLLRLAQDALALKPLARSAKAAPLIDTALAAARIARPGDD